MPEDISISTFTSQNPVVSMNSNGILGYFEPFRKFYAVEDYSEVAIMFRRDCTHTYGGRK